MAGAATARPNVFHGHNLLHEFFACPERFYFFTPTGLSAGLQKVQGNVAEIVILLNRLPPDWLIHQTDAAQFSLFCTPVINLFPAPPPGLKLLTA